MQRVPQRTRRTLSTTLAPVSSPVASSSDPPTNASTKASHNLSRVCKSSPAAECTQTHVARDSCHATRTARATMRVKHAPHWHIHSPPCALAASSHSGRTPSAKQQRLSVRVARVSGADAGVLPSPVAAVRAWATSLTVRPSLNTELQSPHHPQPVTPVQLNTCALTCQHMR